jgi:putative CocE/NonD family hydrolase
MPSFSRPSYAWALLAEIPLVLSLGTIAAQTYEVTAERNVPVKMRDGVVLRSDVYRPKREGRFPVLLQRTPYDKTGVRAFGMRAAARGYIVIVQDVRGRFGSAGDWYPFRHESVDGYDTVEWAAALPYSDGRVGMFGGSYVGATQMLAAVAQPPHLSGLCPYVTASDYHDGWVWQNGAFVLVGELDTLALPASLSALLGARLDSLEPGVRATTERGSVEGELFHRGAVVALSPPAARASV